MRSFVRPAPLLLIGLLAAGCSKLGGAGAGSFKTVAISRGDVLSSIDATGTLEPEDVVDIGAQVTGQILSFGVDPEGNGLDYGSQVKAGQVLAKIDDVPYALARRQAQSQLNLAEANVRVAEENHIRDLASVRQNDARLEQAKAQWSQSKAQLAQAARDWDRAQKLGTGDSLAQSAFDSYRGAFESAQAAVDSAAAAVKAAEAACEVSLSQAKASDATIAQVKSTVEQARVAIDLADRNLGYCTLHSPVDGIVIDRRVDVGQTVVSNLNASSLFLLAKDLKHMQVWTAVNEANIGQVHVGQKVTFTTDANPGCVIEGRVDRVRLNAAMTQNVVTYTVEIGFDNHDGKLLPYLTANVKFEVDRRSNVLTVPNAALRWQPDAALITPGAALPSASEPAAGSEKPAAGGGDAKSGTKQHGDGKTGGKAADGHGGRRGADVIWVADGPTGATVRPIKVKTGITNGAITEVSPMEEGVELEGLAVVVGQQQAAGAGDAGAGSNPFAPKSPFGGRR